MEISGKIIAVLPASSGVSQRTGNPWMSQDSVFETHEQYPKKMSFRMFCEDRIKKFDIKVGEEVSVSFDIDAHEYNGRWYNQVNAWNISRVQPQQPAAAAAPAVGDSPLPQSSASTPFPPQSPSSNQNAGETSTDDLPF